MTYPITTALLGAPKVKAIRGFSDFGFSYVYVIFEDGTDPYWARTRVLEYLSKITGQLPAGVKTELGPDATSVGWVFQYALVDRSGKHSSDELRSYQDWFLRYAVQSVPGVSEVATVGGQVRQYQITVSPDQARRLQAAARGGHHRRAPREQRRGRAARRAVRPRVHGARPRLREVDRRPGEARPQGRGGHAHPGEGRGHGGARSRDPPRRRRLQRGGGRGGRHRGDAPGRERAQRHRAREGEAGRARSRRCPTGSRWSPPTIAPGSSTRRSPP